MAVKWGVLGTAGIARGCTIPGMKMAENCEEPFVSPEFSIKNAKLLDAVLEQIEY